MCAYVRTTRTLGYISFTWFNFEIYLIRNTFFCESDTLILKSIRIYINIGIVDFDEWFCSALSIPIYFPLNIVCSLCTSHCKMFSCVTLILQNVREFWFYKRHFCFERNAMGAFQSNEHYILFSVPPICAGAFSPRLVHFISLTSHISVQNIVKIHRATSCRYKSIWQRITLVFSARRTRLLSEISLTLPIIGQE